jgi:hypothetical protein
MGKLAVIRGGNPADTCETTLVTLAPCGNRAERQRSGNDVIALYVDRTLPSAVSSEKFMS